MIDTGLDVNHPEFAGQVARVFDTSSGGSDVTDLVGHGTFVSGLIAALDGNGRGGKGVAGSTKLIAVRASTDGRFTLADLIRGIDFSIRRGADVINMSLAGDLASPRPRRAPSRPPSSTTCSRSPRPATTPRTATRSSSPRRGRRAPGGRGIGLSVAATKPTATSPRSRTTTTS